MNSSMHYPIMIIISCKNNKEAKKIGKSLINNRLAACVQIIKKIKSYFIFNDNFVSDSEALMLVKTTHEHYEAIVKSVNQLHSHEIPEIISFKMDNINEAYVNWLFNQVEKIS